MIIGRLYQKKHRHSLHVLAWTGAMLGGYSEEDQQTLKTFGYLIGDIFQLSDDYLDIYDTKKQT